MEASRRGGFAHYVDGNNENIDGGNDNADDNNIKVYGDNDNKVAMITLMEKHIMELCLTIKVAYCKWPRNTSNDGERIAKEYGLLL